VAAVLRDVGKFIIKTEIEVIVVSVIWNYFVRNAIWKKQGSKLRLNKVKINPILGLFNGVIMGK
jgi:hypothetical protein